MRRKVKSILFTLCERLLITEAPLNKKTKKHAIVTYINAIPVVIPIFLENARAHSAATLS